MATSEEIKTYIDTSAQRPLEMEQDGRRAKAHSLRDSIAWLKYKQSEENATPEISSEGYSNMGVRVTKIEPGGSA